MDLTLGAPKMRRYPPSTIYRYLDLPSTQIIRIHDSHRHTTTPLLQTLVLAPYPLPIYTTNITATQTQTHVQHSPCSHRIGKAQTQSSDHLPIITTINIRHDNRLQQNRRTFINYNSQKTHSPLSLRPQYPPTYTLPT